MNDVSDWGLLLVLGNKTKDQLGWFVELEFLGVLSTEVAMIFMESSSFRLQSKCRTLK